MTVTKKVRRAGKKPRVVTESVILPGPDELNEPSGNLLDYVITIFGEKGVGKTSLCAQFEDSLVVMTEPMRKNLRIRQYLLEVLTIKEMAKREVSRTPWQVFQQVVESSIADNTISTLVADTIDRLYDACLAHHCYELGITDPSDQNDYGATWRLIKDDFEDTLNSIRLANKGLILVSHAQMKEVEARNGTTYDLCIPTCAPAAFRYIKAACDYAWYFGYHGGKRALYLRGNDLIWSACGVEDRFLDPEGTPIEVLPIPSSPSGAYQALMEAWENKAYDVNYEPPVKKRK